MSFSGEEALASIKKNPISVGCVVLTLALLGVIYFHAGRQAELETELEEKSTQAARLALNLKNAAQLKEQYEAVIAAKKEIESRMIRAEEIPTNQQYFYKLETDAGVKLVSTPRQSPTSKNIKGNYPPTVFSLNVQGDYRQLLTFLRKLESGPRYCRVLNASCSSAADRGSVLILTLSLELLGMP